LKDNKKQEMEAVQITVVLQLSIDLL